MANLSEDVVFALSESRRIGEDVDNDHPMRHQIRNMKEMACRILADAAYQATILSHQAQQLIKDFEESKKEKQE